MPVISTIAAATARAFGAFKSLGGAADEFFDYVTLLLHGDGTNGAQNNTFLDSSTNNFTITRNGNTTQGTFSPFSQTGWSNYFDGSGDYLSVADNAAWDFGSGDFTIECWAYTETFASQYNVLICQWNTSNAWIFRITSSLVGLYANIGGTQNYTASVTNTTGQWDHFCVTRSSGTLTFYKNGVSVGTAAISGTINNATDSVTIGILGDANATTIHKGYISGLRVIKGSAVAPTASSILTPATAVTGTSLLTCQSNRFRDASSNNFAITRNGDVSVQAFSPFAPTAAYSAATVGGSGYFDGSGDYLTYTYGSEVAFGTGDFTVEWWQYSTDTNSGILQGDSGAGWGATIISGTFYWQSVVNVTNKLSASVSAYLTDSWNHWAVVRSSGTLTLYINGTQIASVSDTTNYSDSSGTMNIGYYPANGNYILGYLSNLRIVKGTAVYTSAFTPPTSPLTAISGTSLLLNFTNGGIIDNTAKNVLETVGNAQISTSVKKFGTGSLAFDGNDSLVGPPSMYPQYINGTGNWTIEFWVYYNALPTGSQGASTGCSWYAQDDGAAVVSPFNLIQAGNSWYLYADNDGSGWDIFSATSLATTSLSTGTWYHIACVRNGSTITLYVNGTSAGTASIGTASIWTNTTRKLYLFGSWQNISGTNGLNGYVDDYRITKGVARYTANFTPPTAAFEDQ